VGQGLQVLCVLVLAPYVLLSAIAFAKADPARWAWSERPADGTVDWTTLLTLLYWNVSGWDCASTFAGEVKEPGRTYPRALGMALLIMLAAYAVPLLAASGCVDAGDWRLWKDGSFASIAQGVGGEWLGVLIVSSAALGNWGLFASELLEDSYQLLGMAEAGLAPRMFSRRHPKFHTPVSAILFQFTIICVLIGFDFNTILTVDNFFSAAQAVLEFVAFVKLRVSRPDLERPFRVPLSTAGSIAMLSIPTALACATSLACVTASLGAACVNGVAVLGGIALYLLAGDKCTGCLPKFGRRRRAAAAHAAHAPACEPRIDGLREGLLPRPEPEEAGQLH
jgi:amino acid transporter